MDRVIDYQKAMQTAFRRLMVDVLRDVAENGLPGKHHFYITFDTTHPGVDIAGWMHGEYPSEMTIVMQDWYDNLTVTDDRFGVTLNFRETAEPLVIPFDAVRAFVDPSVEFGLKFEAPSGMPDPDDPPPSDPVEADVVRLDAFRKS